MSSFPKPEVGRGELCSHKRHRDTPRHAEYRRWGDADRHARYVSGSDGNELCCLDHTSPEPPFTPRRMSLDTDGHYLRDAVLS